MERIDLYFGAIVNTSGHEVGIKLEVFEDGTMLATITDTDQGRVTKIQFPAEVDKGVATYETTDI